MVVFTNEVGFRKFWRTSLTAACSLLLAACGGRVEGTDSSTHWLDQCNDDDDCGSGLQCECGSCTKGCDAITDCNGLTEATCATAHCGQSVVAACTRACSKDSECGDGECFDGTCAFALQCTVGNCLTDRDASVSPDTTNEPRTDADTLSSGADTIDETIDADAPVSNGTGDNCSGPDCDGETTTPGEEDSGGGSSSDGTSGETSEVPGGSTCPAMDVADNGDDCVGEVASYWNGSECVSVQWCGCTGTDCGELFTYIEDCRSRYAACIDDIPECTDEIDIEEDTDTGALTPQGGTGLWFKIEGEEPGQFEEDPSVAPFAEFTEAEWRGQEQPDSGDPDPYSLTFVVGGERVKFGFYFGEWDWPLPPDPGGVQLGDTVELRVVRADGAPVELQVRDTSATPFLWVVQNSPGATQTQWSFGNLNLRIGAPICKRISQPCNWLFTLDQLIVTSGSFESALGPGENAYTGPDAPRYEILSDYQFSNNKPAFGDEACASALPRYDAFLVWRDDSIGDD